MLERLLLASTVTCLLYLSGQIGQSSVTPIRTNQTFRYVTIDGSLMSNLQENQSQLTVADSPMRKIPITKKPV
ncbi:MAG TPA: hypothetical protein DCF68_06295 [Cyanothece sp. UBA12306]|nr:hypothetical protein [Cyanothece sp. UBA12306]